MRQNLTCKHQDCHNYVEARGLCSKHYRRLLRHGDSSVVTKRGAEVVFYDKPTDGIAWPATVGFKPEV